MSEIRVFPLPRAETPVTPWPVIHRALIDSLEERARVHVFDGQRDGGEWDLDTFVQRFGANGSGDASGAPLAKVIDLSAERRRRRVRGLHLP